MEKHFIIFLSILIIAQSVSAIEITEFETINTTPTTTIQATGTNIEVAILKDFIDTEIEMLKQEFMAGLELEKEELNQRLEKAINYIALKLGLGIVAICLFIFNLSLSYKLLTEVVFKNG